MLQSDNTSLLPDHHAIFTISRLNQQVRLLLEQKIGKIWLSGEVSNFSQPASGHWYFTLKDAAAQVRCAMFRNSNRQVGFVPRQGQQVLVRATITLYEPRGDYQVIAESLHQAGEGVLQQRYQQLKQQLFSEGLFDIRYKQPLPALVRRVGVITSRSGAALHDILQVLQRRDTSLPVVIYPTAVQGEEACRQLVRALTLANQRAECDVLIVGRGGGSLEDLWCFNDERVARAIFASEIPVVSAVGHEIDVTIADFVADVRAATPSAAAELVSRDRQELSRRLVSSQQRLNLALDHFMARCHQRLVQAVHRLQQQHPQSRLVRWQTALVSLRQRLVIALQGRLRQAELMQRQAWQRLYQQRPDVRIQRARTQLERQQYRLQQALAQQLSARRQRFASVLARLETVSPLATLARGYSVTRDAEDQLVRNISQLQVDDLLTTRLHDGWLYSRVTAIRPLELPL